MTQTGRDNLARKSNSNIKSKYQLLKEKYKFKIDDVVIYLGGLYTEYKNCKATVLSRSNQKSMNYYTVEFENGKIMELKENWIEKWEETDEDNQTEL